MIEYKDAQISCQKMVIGLLIKQPHQHQQALAILNIRGVRILFELFRCYFFDSIQNKYIGSMGQCMPDNKYKITFASLNYSGVQQSPYEFYENENQSEKHLNQLFSQNCHQKFQNPDFKWSMGKLDKDWHQRYSPLYNKTCGIKQNNRLMLRDEFEKEWDQWDEKYFPSIEKTVYGKLSGDEKQKAILRDKSQLKFFDFMAYKSLVMHIYKVKDIQPNMDAKEFKSFQEKMFSKPFLNAQLKQRYTIKSIHDNKIDVLFLQECNPQLIKEIEKKTENLYYAVERFDQKSTSVILFSKKKFPNFKHFKSFNKHFLETYSQFIKEDGEKDLFWNQDTVFQMAGGKTLFCNLHLTSKVPANSQQIKKVQQSLEKLSKAFPDIDIIVGGDFNNAQFPSPGSYTNYFIFPNYKVDSTVNKKRTMMQVQKHKANELNDGTKDYLLSNVKMSGAEITTIDNKRVKKGKDLPLLPNTKHPYDHYMLFGEILLDKQTYERQPKR